MTKKKGMSTRFSVVNVVATMNCGFHIDLEKVWQSPYLLYVSETGNIYTAIRPPGATKQITIFYNGNMITVGNKTVTEARKNLETAKKWLRRYRSRNGVRVKGCFRKAGMKKKEKTEVNQKDVQA